MTELERKGGILMADKAVEKEEEESLLMEDVAVLDFDLLCATVALQTQKGKWGKLNEDHEDASSVSGYQNGGGAFRMWEGEIIYDCFDDRRVSLQSTFCPCYRFGKNMKRAGFGSCFLQGSLQLILTLAALSSLLAFVLTGSRGFAYSAVVFTVFVGTYMGIFRTLIRKKFNIKGSDSAFDDCVYHLVCPCCTLCQESRTLEMNNVADGIWHGRGDTICIGTVLTKSPNRLTMEKNSNDGSCLPASLEENAPFVPPPAFLV